MFADKNKESKHVSQHIYFPEFFFCSDLFDSFFIEV